MNDFAKALFSKHVLIISESYDIFRLKGTFFTKLLGNRDGAVRAFKYFVAVHVVLLSLLSLTGLAGLPTGLTLIKSEIYVMIAVITVLPQVLAIKIVATIRRVRIPLYGAFEIVFYAAAYFFVALGLAGVAVFAIAVATLMFVARGGTGSFSIWHWMVVLTVIYAMATYFKYQVLWLHGKFGLPKAQSLLAMLLTQAALGAVVVLTGSAQS
jgi:hypothetical protein